MVTPTFELVDLATLSIRDFFIPLIYFVLELGFMAAGWLGHLAKDCAYLR